MGKFLKEKEIPSVFYYSVPLHLQSVFKSLGYDAGDFLVAEKVANQCLSLPINPNLTQVSSMNNLIVKTYNENLHNS
jgi:dTDP-4-amino-4,6-dideoxygalactose transaminase